jgi:hypothetical protein
MHPVTYQGLQIWITNLFQQLGWMLVIKENNHNQYKIESYKESIKQLTLHLKDYRKRTKDEDKKNDLKTMITHTAILDKYVKKIL